VHEDLPVLRREHSGKRSTGRYCGEWLDESAEPAQSLPPKPALTGGGNLMRALSTRTQTAALTILVGCAVSIGSLLLPWTVGLGGIFPVPAATGFDAPVLVLPKW
jgi:hypothetical protein